MAKTKKTMAIIALIAVITLAFTALSLTGCEQPTSPKVKELSGAISISPDSNVTTGTELTAAYDGDEVVSYQWYKDGVAINSATTNKYTPAEAGSYTVTVSVEGYASKTSAPVTVTGKTLSTLSGTVSIEPAENVTVGMELTAEYSGNEGVSYQWNKGGVAIDDETNQTYTPIVPGTYTVTASKEGYVSKTSDPVIVTLKIITSAEIEITAPVMNDTPDTAPTTDDENYTVGTATWSPNDAAFKSDTVYTVTVTLTANTDFTFTGLTTAKINGETATVSNNTGAAVTLSYTFPATDTKAVNDITIKTQPTNLTYTHGDALNLAGLEITLKFDDNTTDDVAAANFAARNITTIPPHDEHLIHSTHNNQPVVIKYGSNHSVDTNNLTVNAKAINDSSITVVAIPAETYSGSAHEPTVTVRDGETTLAKDTDYTVGYTDNTNAGTASVTITGAGNYTGTRTVTFTINRKAIDAGGITVDPNPIPAQIYIGSALTPTVTVKDGETTLTPTTDYTVEYSNNTSGGTAIVTITGAGNYSGTRTVNFTINTPIPLTVNQWTNGSLPTSSDVQWFSFTATASTQYIHFSPSGLTGASVQLYTSSGVASGNVTSLTGSSSSTSRTGLTAEQTYYIRVTPFGGTGSYRIGFTASFVAPPGAATPLIENEWTDGSIPTGGGQEWFSFTATASEQFIHFDFGTLTNLYVQLYTSSGATSGSETQFSSSTTSSTSRTGLTPGATYYIKVRGYYAANSGTYRIGFNTSFIQPGVTSIPLTENQWTDGNLPTSDDVQWFTFTATADTQYIHLGPGSVEVRVQLYTSSGIAVEDEPNMNSILSSSISRSLTNGQTYYIRVRPTYGSNGGAYRITFNTSFIQPGVTPISLTENQWADGSLPTSNDVQWFTFTATADTQYIHFSPGAMANVNVQVYNSSGAAVGSGTSLSTVTRNTSRTLESGQTYYIRVRGNSAGTYWIGFTTSTTAPNRVQIPSNAIQLLTENQWTDGNLPTSSDVQWFVFTATADTQYLHYSPVSGLSGGVYVQVYDSSGAAVGNETRLQSSATNTERTLESGQTYHIRVRPWSSTVSGTYRIGFTTSTTAPAS